VFGFARSEVILGTSDFAISLFLLIWLNASMRFRAVMVNTVDCKSPITLEASREDCLFSFGIFHWRG
jgi:hypothetical protein